MIKKLTIKEIAPWWAKQIEKGHLELYGTERRLMDEGTCIVGEAHGWTPAYDCDICGVMGDDLFKIADGNEGLVNSDFLLELKDFVKHWNKKHASERK